MKKLTEKFGLLAAITLVSLPVLGTSRASAQAGGNTGIVSDNAPNMVRSDGVGPYIDGVDCASVAISSPGFWQLRTVANTGVCKSDTTPRYLIVDFGTATAPGDFDGHNGIQSVEFAPARFIFNDGYVRKATTTPVHIYVLKVNPDGSTTQDTAWTINYQAPASITLNPDGSRTFSSAGPGAADIYSVIRLNGGREQSQFVGTYNLPFSVTAK